MTDVFRILTLIDESEVLNILSRAPESDVIADPRYLRLFEAYTGQQAIYFHYTRDQGEILLPFFERPLPKRSGEEQKDLVSPWYYGGPIHTFTDESAAGVAFKDMLSRMHEHCLEAGIVSEFQRLNPVLQNHRLYEGDPSLQFNRKIVSIDLSNSLADIRSAYEYKARKNLRRAEASGLRVVRGVNDASVAAFKALYTVSMDRKGASDFYYFNNEFFQKLFDAFPEGAQLFTVYAGDDAAVSSIALGNGSVLHDYLRAGNPAHFAARPNDFVVDAIIEWAKNAGYREYALGGGHSANGEDDLFRFKRSFSPLTRDYYLYKRVHDRKSYDQRCSDDGVTERQYEEADHFPEYRVT